MIRRVYTTTESDLTPSVTQGSDERVTGAEPYKGYGVTPELREQLRDNALRNEQAQRREYLRQRALRHLK